MSGRPADGEPTMRCAASIQLFCQHDSHKQLPDGRRARKNVRLLDVHVWELQGETTVVIEDATPGAKRSRAEVQADMARIHASGRIPQPGTDDWPAFTRERTDQALHVVAQDGQPVKRVVWDLRCPIPTCRYTVEARLENLRPIMHKLAAAGLPELSLQALASLLNDKQEAARRSAK